MTTARAGDPGAAAVDAPDAGAGAAGADVVAELADDEITVELAALELTADDIRVELSPATLDDEPPGLLDVPRLPRRFSALLVLLVLPIAVALTVAAMTLMLPSAEADRAGTATAAMSKVRVAVLDGADDPELVRLVTERLTAADITVVPGGRAQGGPHEHTEVVYHDPAARMSAAEVRRVLRVGKVILDPGLAGTAEVSIIVGKDFRYA